VSEEDPTILEPGMVITMEPGVATEYGIFHVEENVIVTDSTPEIISVSPWELRTLRDA
jgi:Xaa-Pro aminopeptidase